MTAVPDDIAGYRITRLLGVGDLGTVHVARNPVLPRDDAVRVVAPRLAANPEFAAEFDRAVEAVSVLSHPNVLPVYARGKSGEWLWLAMQYADGCDLGALVGRDVPSPARSARILTEVARALDYVHAHRMVHGAVHPGNVLLSSADSGTERVMLADVGFARALDAAGTPRQSRSAAPYLAPEVLKGAPYDRSADLYSLGAVLFHLWTGRVPDASIPLAEATADLPPACGAVLARALARDPATRFDTAGELATAALQAAPTDVVPPPARPATTAPLTAEPERGRRPRRLSVAAAVLIAAAVVAALSIPFAGRSVPGNATMSGSPPAPVRAKELTGLLLSGDELGKILGAPLTLVQDEKTMGKEDQTNDACAGAFVPGEIREYATTGYVGVRFQRWAEKVAPGGVDGVLPAVSQAVVAFPSVAVAELFRQREIDRWTACANQRIQVYVGGQMMLTDVAMNDRGFLTLKQTLEGGMGISCGRAFTIRNNVSVDVAVCFTDEDQKNAVDVAQRIADGVPE